MTLKILAVEDSLTVRTMIEHVLKGAGYEVHLAEDGQHGLKRLAEVQPDMITTDMNMPIMDGLGFIKGVRADARYKMTPILVISSETAPELKNKARALGASGWMAKPFHDERLISAVKRLAA
ncbi:response regulator [Parvularcula maris]|uniref:Response regulator n=1 Tax=Parvularcula maris TaxID=2965077 RepID=A0A9X2L992_9PROT|nr:response regulator [Parvularcula maris]